MLDFKPTEEDLAIAATVRAFVDRELKPLESFLLERDIAGGPPGLTMEERDGLRAKAEASGLWGISVPEEYGGPGLGYVAQAMVAFELGRTPIEFFFGGFVPDILYLLNDEQKERYLLPTLKGDREFCFMLSEPGVGSDARNVRTTATREGDDWVISGEKIWISNGNEADYGVVFCRTVDGGTEKGITAFLVDRDMGWKSSEIKMMGTHHAASISFQDVRVPDANRFGEVGEGFTTAMSFIHTNRALLLPGLMVGACERMLEMAIEHSKNRVTFGKPLAERENIKFMIAESEIELRALKLMVLHAAWQADQSVDIRHSACFTKFYGANVANRVVDRVLQIHGGIGYSKEMPIERWYRDLRVARIYEGSDEMNLQTISRNLLKGYEPVGKLW
ncbi:acyl-CoA dehydrogenase family protein [Nocardioides sp. 1609]|uniref:acyl-CoA dehydrogenase family protein n=1 Tax=Nocardioides sp. 1609 TaxID=2508327 RepID=UPI001ADB48D5|nr:acyl-CoA dehydrogenase family protein [Nocardioides sp. 1609]